MSLLDLRQRAGTLFGGLTILHVIVISAQVTTRQGVPLLEQAVLGLFAEVQRGASAAFDGLGHAWDRYVALTNVGEENEVLRRQVGALQVQLQQQEALAARARTLQELLDLRDSTPLETVAATLIGSGASPEFRTVTIDKGTDQGLRSEMAVIAPSGVVGRVIVPGARAARVQLLIDRNAAAGVLVERSRVQGVVVGTGEDRLRLEYLPGRPDVRVGDRVVTSGIDGIYPKGFVVGQIESLEGTAGGFRDITIRPAVDFSRLEDVLVVLTPPAGADAAGDE